MKRTDQKTGGSSLVERARSENRELVTAHYSLVLASNYRCCHFVYN
jgi:hypothetical protein